MRICSESHTVCICQGNLQQRSHSVRALHASRPLKWRLYIYLRTETDLHSQMTLAREAALRQAETRDPRIRAEKRARCGQ